MDAPDPISPASPVPPAAAAAPAARAQTHLERGLETLQTVLTALILAFIFRAFLVEQFIIPTGSMAPTLLGTHATFVCPACGWEYDFAPQNVTAAADGTFVRPTEIVCPNCQLRLVPTAETTVPRSGDRILVHKWPYALSSWFGPHRWDVIVFRDPANPEQHYIKRLIALPGETLEIIDGDVFIDGRIARKPDEVQRALWFLVFDQEHVPSPAAASGRWARWVPKVHGDTDAPAWSGMRSRVITFDGLDQPAQSIAFNTDAGREYLTDLYAYNGRSSGAFVRDVRLRGDVTFEDGPGWLEWEIARDPDRFRLRLGADGTLTVTRVSRSGDAELLGRRNVAVHAGRPLALEFGHVDYRVYARVNGRPVFATTDEQYSATAREARRRGGMGRPVGLSLTADNVRLEIRKLRVERDVYYTHSRGSRRAYAGDPFQLRDNEYFVLGDNSPDSYDSREWDEASPQLPDDYRLGTVRADQIVGQAAFVYLPGLLPADARGTWSLPDLGRIRFVR